MGDGSQYLHCLHDSLFDFRPQAVMNELNSYSFFLRTLVSVYMNSLGVEVFMARTVHEVLWGFKDPLLSKIHSMKPEVDEYFGLMWKVSMVISMPLFFFFRGKLDVISLPKQEGETKLSCDGC